MPTATPVRTVNTAKRFEILRGIKSDSSVIAANLPEKPHRVYLLLNEQKFNERRALVHHDTVFVEERLHDWDWRNGNFFYYSHAVEIGGACDVVIVYETEEVER